MTGSRKALWAAACLIAVGILFVVGLRLQKPVPAEDPPAPVVTNKAPVPDPLEETGDGVDLSWDTVGRVPFDEREKLVQWAWLEIRTLEQDVQAMALDRMNNSGQPFDINPFLEERDAFQQAVLAARDASPEAWPEIRLRLARDWAALDATVKDLFDIP